MAAISPDLIEGGRGEGAGIGHPVSRPFEAAVTVILHLGESNVGRHR